VQSAECGVRSEKLNKGNAGDLTQWPQAGRPGNGERGTRGEKRGNCQNGRWRPMAGIRDSGIGFGIRPPTVYSTLRLGCCAAVLLNRRANGRARGRRGGSGDPPRNRATLNCSRGPCEQEPTAGCAGKEARRARLPAARFSDLNPRTLDARPSQTAQKLLRYGRLMSPSAFGQPGHLRFLESQVTF